MGVGNTEGRGIVCLSLVRGEGWGNNSLYWFTSPPFPTETACSMPVIYLSNSGYAWSYVQKFTEVIEWVLKELRSSLLRRIWLLPLPLVTWPSHKCIRSSRLSYSFLLLRIRYQRFWQNFINSMCNIKFWKGNENLWSVYKKTVFQNFERFLPFLIFFSSQKGSLSLLSDENFFSLNRSNGASKNPAFFSYWFQKCTYDLRKKCTQKKF